MRKFLVIAVFALLLLGCQSTADDDLGVVKAELGDGGYGVNWIVHQEEIKFRYPETFFGTGWEELDDVGAANFDSWQATYSKENSKIYIRPDFELPFREHFSTYEIAWTYEDEVLASWALDSLESRAEYRDCNIPTFVCKNYGVRMYPRNDFGSDSLRDIYFLNPKPGKEVPYLRIDADNGVYPEYIDKVLLDSLEVL